MPHLNTWGSDLFSDVIWCLAKTMAKLERNSLGTEPWPWCVNVLFSKEQSDPSLAHVVCSHKAQAVLAAIFKPILASVSQVFCSLWLMPDSCCVSTFSAELLLPLHFCAVLWPHASGGPGPWSRRASTPCLFKEMGFLYLFGSAFPYGADLQLINPIADWVGVFSCIFPIRENYCSELVEETCSSFSTEKAQILPAPPQAFCKVLTI